MLKEGKYEAKVIDFGIGETKDGNPQILILFAIDNERQHHELTWYGSLKEGKAREFTMKTLLTCGCKTNNLIELADGAPSGLLDLDTPLSLVVELESKEPGKFYPRVKYINRVGGGAFRALAAKDAKARFADLNLKGDMVAMRQEQGAPAAGKRQEPAYDPNFDQDVGF